jgi:hypothetical protein
VNMLGESLMGEVPLDERADEGAGEPALDIDPGVEAPLRYPLALTGLATCR